MTSAPAACLPATTVDLQQRLPGHHFPLAANYYALRLVRSGASLRATARILAWMLPECGVAADAPCYQTVRQWLLRVGLHQLQRANNGSGDDWVWIIDHTQQLGDMKVLLIVGLRLPDWKSDRPLEQSDVKLLLQEPEANSTAEIVSNHLQKLYQQIGAPRVIVSDGARDLRLAHTLFQERHPELSVAWMYDIKHFTAIQLKRELENDARWQAFTAAANRTKQQCSVTALAALHPPNQRGKARYLNLQELIAWGGKMLVLLDVPRGATQLGLDQAKCEAKLGWLQEYREDIAQWAAAMRVIELIESHIRRGGVHRRVIEELKPQVDAAATGPLSQRLRDRLLAHLAEQMQQLKDDERLPSSSEVLESLIGTYKRLQAEQSHHGITPLVLGLGALMTDDLAATIQSALRTTHTRDLTTWCREHLGTTLQGCRQRLHRFLANATKPDPQPAAP